jgi:hypothetical protein
VKVLHMNYSSLQMALVSLSPFSLCFFFSTWLLLSDAEFNP